MSVVNQEVEDFLEHFGVKGMKWGQRKSRAEKLQAHAGKRPTRGNVRKAQRAQIAENRRANKKPMSSRQKKVLVGVLAGGALFAAAMVAKNKGLKISDLQRGPVRQPTASSFSSRLPGSKVTRINGAIPLGRGGANKTLKTNGKTLLKDLPKVGGKTPVPQDMQAAARRALAGFENRPTPASIGLKTLRS